MVLYWVIDASVIGVANNPDHPRGFDAAGLLYLLHLRGLQIVLNEEIEGEYRRLSQESPKGLGSRWWYKMQGSGKLERRYQSIPNRIARELRARQFHDDDYKYVAAAVSVSTGNSDNQIVCLVQEDRKDFAKIDDLLSDNGIRLATTEQAIEIIDTEDENA